jgi:hypothetical protein
MTMVLENVRRLENYLEWRGGYADDVMDLTINKMLQRERVQMEAQLKRLQAELTAFEAQYGLSSPAFHERFERGELGDDIDYFEWSATWEMVQQLQQGLRLLS